MFSKINSSGSGQIAFDEWLFIHIRGKAATLSHSSKVHWNEDAANFKRWIVAASRTKTSKEYKELFHFLQECFTAADQDLDGKVNHAEFDTMIDVAAEAPRCFGFAPSA